MISDIIFSLALIILSIIWIIKGVFELGFWIPGVSAGSGFIPTIFAALTLVSTVFLMISDLKKMKTFQSEKADIKTEEQDSGEGAEAKDNQTKLASAEVSKRAAWLVRLNTYVPVVFCLIGILSLKLFGLVITVFALSLSWLHFISRTNWKKSLVVSSTITLIIYLIFELWLEIPFPGDILKL